MTKEAIYNAFPTTEQKEQCIRLLAEQLVASGNEDALLRAIGVPLLEELHILAAKAQLSRMTITRDNRIILTDYNKEIVMQPVHKTVYFLFLNHPEGINFKDLSEYKDELKAIYSRIAPNAEREKIETVVAHLTDPLDNAINEKCSRIKNMFMSIMDEYTASYYVISGHKRKEIHNSSRVWFTRHHSITLPRELVTFE